jgi:hypothetical protein
VKRKPKAPPIPSGPARLGRLLKLFAANNGEIPHDLYVEGRSCGTCTMCCKLPGIRAVDLTEEERKLVPPHPPGTACKHCTATGCAVYDRRPGVCRDFYCGFMAGLVDERPDTTGVTWTLRDTSETAHLEGMGLRVSGQCLDIEKALRDPVVRAQIRLLGSMCLQYPVFKIILCDPHHQLGIDLTGHRNDSIVMHDPASDPDQPEVDLNTMRVIHLPWYPKALRSPDSRKQTPISSIR